MYVGMKNSTVYNEQSACSSCTKKQVFDGDDKPKSNCGIVGVYNHPQAAIIAYYALHALQHRGQEAAGIVASRFDEHKQRTTFVAHRGEGLVLDVFSEPQILTSTLAGTNAIAHNRYSTTGSGGLANVQPFSIKYRHGNVALAHNGNLTNTRPLRSQLQEEGAIFQSTTDSELFLHLIARSRKDTQLEQIREALQITRGAYSVVIMTEKALYAARDPHGFRPLSVGRIRLEDGRFSYIVASETCAFDIVNAEWIRDIEHNELVVIDDETLRSGIIKSYNIDEVTPRAAHCIFEYIYFSRPDSRIFGHSVDKVRRKLGKSLAEESPVLPDEPDEKVIATAVPDSANTATLGFAHRAQKEGLPVRFELGLIRSHYVGRSFIAPGQDSREFKVKTKFNVVRGVINERNVVLVDDSIVRGTTSKILVDQIRAAEPKKLHMRISSPPITHPCYYGMDFPSRSELIANHYNSDEEAIGKYLGVDSLRYLSVEKLMDSVPKDENVGYCTACFTGKYPIPVERGVTKEQTED